MREMLVKENDANQRLDKFISKAVPLLPKALMYKYIRNKKIKVNRKRCEINQRLAVGDVVTYYMAEEFFSSSVDLDFLACTLTPRVIYEDEMILVLYKPAGVSIHADEKFPVENLVNAMKKYLYEKKDYEPKQEHSFSPSVVNRLDRNTEGLVLAAKTYEALKDLNEMVKNHQIQKRYLAVVSGKVTPKSAHVIAYHQKDREENKAKVSLTPREGYKEMITNYHVVQQNAQYSLVDIDLVTGRFHQIRAQFAALSHPLVGDRKYGAKTKGVADYRLCAYRLDFASDISGCLSGLSSKTIQLEPTTMLAYFEALTKA